MDQIENIIQLPDELLDFDNFESISDSVFTDYSKVTSPIKSPDLNSSTQFFNNQIETKTIPTDTPKTPDNQVLKSLDPNVELTLSTRRPKRAAALVASSNLKTMKRRHSNSSDRHNSFTAYDSGKENQTVETKRSGGKKRKTLSQSSKNLLSQIDENTISPIIPLQQQINNENEDEKSKEEQVILFLSQQQQLLQNYFNADEIYTQTVQRTEQDHKVTESDITLQLTCESDEEYDLLNANLNFRASKTSTLVKSESLFYSQSSDPKLSDFFVNKSNNFEFTNIALENQKLNSLFLNNVETNQTLNTPTKIDRTKELYALSVNLAHEYETDDLGFTIYRSKEPNLEQHFEQLNHNIETCKEPEPIVDENNNLVEISSHEEDQESSDTIKYNGIDLLELDCGKGSDQHVGFAFNVAKVLFSREELLNGIFVDTEKKNRSKNRVPFDSHRVQVIKEALITKFKYDVDEIENVWKSVRPDLNKKLSSIKKK